MKIHVHRGAEEIGGNCIELEAEGYRLVLDIGSPLDRPEHPDLVPAVSGFRERDPSLLGVVVSHPHQDHYGLAKFIRPEIQIWIGDGARRVIEAANPFLPTPTYLKTPCPYADRTPFEVGPFRVTPFLVDHSAHDSYAFIVEAGSKRLFYSGDLRAHGRHGDRFDDLLADMPSGIDVALTEGTCFGREGADQPSVREADLTAKFGTTFRETPGLGLVLASPQNVDRMRTMYDAAQAAGRTLLIDLYAAEVLAAVDDPNIPDTTWPGVRVFVPDFQRAHVYNSSLFTTLDRYRDVRVFPEAIAKTPGQFVLLFRPAMTRQLDALNVTAGARLIYSMWEGYLTEPRMFPFVDWRERSGIPMEMIHTSGHAGLTDLTRLVNSLQAGRNVTIHTSQPELASLVSSAEPELTYE